MSQANVPRSLTWKSCWVTLGSGRGRELGESSLQRSSSPASPYSGVGLDPWGRLTPPGPLRPTRDGTQTEPRREEGGYIQGSSTSPVATDSANMERTLRRAPEEDFLQAVLTWLSANNPNTSNSQHGLRSHLARQGTVQYWWKSYQAKIRQF